MRYVFFGTPRFAALVLEGLIAAGAQPLAVVTNPDRPAGRKKTVTPPPVKALAAAHGIPVLQPETLKGENVERELQTLEAEFFLVAAYGKIIPKNILALPRHGAIGVHPSLLPRHRGPSPIQTAILSGDPTTGVTLFLLDEEVDHGPILAARELPLTGNETYESLEARLAALGGALTAEVIPRFLDGSAAPHQQEESKATSTKKFLTNDGFVPHEDLANPTKAHEIHRKIRALSPEPGVWTEEDGRRMKLLDADYIDGRLKLKIIQYAGEKPKPAP